jgi:hypothetical protein
VRSTFQRHLYQRSARPSWVRGLLRFQRCGATNSILRAAREDILRNRSNVAERLGILGRLIHGLKLGAWLKDLKARVVEVGEYVEAPD